MGEDAPKSFYQRYLLEEMERLLGEDGTARYVAGSRRKSGVDHTVHFGGQSTIQSVVQLYAILLEVHVHVLEGVGCNDLHLTDRKSVV